MADCRDMESEVLSQFGSRNHFNLVVSLTYGCVALGSKGVLAFLVTTGGEHTSCIVLSHGRHGGFALIDF